MGTRVGFFAFMGLILGTVAGIWMPFAASIEAGAGFIIGVVLAIVLDRTGTSTASPEDNAE